MKPSQNSAPVFFRLIDSDQERAERTVKEVTETAAKLGVSEILQLRNLSEKPDEGWFSIFSLNLETGMKADAADKALSFLEHIFKNMFHKHPAYTEPEL